jgi:CHAD domain-containing protein
MPQGKEIDVGQLVAGSLDHRWTKYATELLRCRTKCSEKAVHDLRVATRRLLSTLEMITLFLDDPAIRTLRQRLRKRFKEFGPLRDVQVQLMRAERMRKDFPEIEPFFTLLLLRERRLLKRMERQLGKLRPGDMEVDVAACRSRTLSFFDDIKVSAAARAALLGAAAASYAASVAHLQKIDSSTTDTIHRLRITFKKFRYRMEMILPLLSWGSLRTIKEMNAYQVSMGNIQDIEVFLFAFERFMKQAGRKSSNLVLRQRLEREKMALVGNFVEQSGQLYSFWKSQPPASIQSRAG